MTIDWVLCIALGSFLLGILLGLYLKSTIWKNDDFFERGRKR
jgi:hypothetical protein